MQLQSSTKFTTHPDVVYTALKEGGSVLLHLGTQTYYSLNETGSTIWELMAKDLCLGKIGEALERSYAVSLEQAQHSVFNLATELAAESLIISFDPA
jgi:hypothetical protein